MLPKEIVTAPVPSSAYFIHSTNCNTGGSAWTPVTLSYCEGAQGAQRLWNWYSWENSKLFGPSPWHLALGGSVWAGPIGRGDLHGPFQPQPFCDGFFSYTSKSCKELVTSAALSWLHIASPCSSADVSCLICWSLTGSFCCHAIHEFEMGLARSKKSFLVIITEIVRGIRNLQIQLVGSFPMRDKKSDFQEIGKMT